MKPFNLEEAKAGKPVCTRDGRDARVVCFDAKGEFPIVGLVTVEKDPDIESAAHFCINGDYFSDGHECVSDLFMKSEIKKSVGYRRYLWKTPLGLAVVCSHYEDSELSCSFCEGSEGFVRWIDAEYQYEEYEE